MVIAGVNEVEALRTEILQPPRNLPLSRHITITVGAGDIREVEMFEMAVMGERLQVVDSRKTNDNNLLIHILLFYYSNIYEKYAKNIDMISFFCNFAP